MVECPDQIKADWRQQRSKCDGIQAAMDRAACDWSTQRRAACQSYENCMRDKNHPDFQPCTVPELYPYTAAYVEAEFTSLPVQAKGNRDKNYCQALMDASQIKEMEAPCQDLSDNCASLISQHGCTNQDVTVSSKPLDVYCVKSCNKCPTTASNPSNGGVLTPA